MIVDYAIHDESRKGNKNTRTSTSNIKTNKRKRTVVTKKQKRIHLI